MILVHTTYLDIVILLIIFVEWSDDKFLFDEELSCIQILINEVFYEKKKQNIEKSERA